MEDESDVIMLYSNETGNYSELDVEILNLIKFHEQLMLHAEQEGTPDPEREARRDAFNKFKIQVHNMAAMRREKAVAEWDVEEKLQEERIKVKCATCNKEQLVYIIDEHRHQALGSMHDVVQCRVCETIFLNVMPNNWPDRTLYYNHMIEFLSKRRNPKETKLEKEGRLLAKESMTALRDLNLQVLEDDRIRDEAFQNSEAILVQFRDQLLEGKVVLSNYGNNQGMA